MNWSISTSSNSRPLLSGRVLCMIEQISSTSTATIMNDLQDHANISNRFLQPFSGLFVADKYAYKSFESFLRIINTRWRITLVSTEFDWIVPVWQLIDLPTWVCGRIYPWQNRCCSKGMSCSFHPVKKMGLVPALNPLSSFKISIDLGQSLLIMSIIVRAQLMMPSWDR